MNSERRFTTSARQVDTDVPGLVLEDDGTVWKVAADGTRTEVGSGGGGETGPTGPTGPSGSAGATGASAATPVQATYSGNGNNVTNGATGQATVDSLESGIELLDRSDVSNPTFLTAGTYAITVGIRSNADLTAGGYAVVEVTAGPDATSSGNAVEHPHLGGGVTPLTAVVGAGDTLKVFVTNKDGASTRQFTLAGLVLVKLA